MHKGCPECLQKLKELQEVCQSCGYRVELVPEEEEQRRFLRRVSPGGLLFPQAYAFGTRQYLWFILSILPLTVLIVLPALFVYGRRWSWKVGGWESFAAYKKRQILMDRIGIVWIHVVVLVILYFGFVR